MRNKHFQSYSLLSYLILSAISLLLISCSHEEDHSVTPEIDNIDKELVLVPKVLAVVKLENNIDLIFRSESDGVVLEAYGSAAIYKGLGNLKALSTLEIFLAVTHDNVAVPRDLVLIEENQKIIAKANERKSIEKHDKVLALREPLISQKFEGSYCVGSAKYNTYDQSGKYYRIFNNYNAGAAGTTFYGSGKQGANKCKRLELEITNCNAYSSLKVKTYYKNVFGNYKLKKTINISPQTCTTYRKTFPSRRYRRTSVSSSGNLSNHKFGGYLLYTKY